MTTLKHKRLLTRAKLYKKLFYSLVDNTELKDYKEKINFRVCNKLHRYNNTRVRTITKYLYNNREIKKDKKYTVCFDFTILEQLAYTGFSNDYYKCRHLTLSFLLQNKKLLARFIILHELKHIIDDLKGYSYDYFIGKINECGRFIHTSEINADKWSCNKLKDLKLISRY